MSDDQDNKNDQTLGPQTPQVTLYTTMLCPFCYQAKGLLQQKGVSFEEIDVTMNSEKRAAMRDRAGGRNTVPQIFIGDVHVGGCDDLFALEHAGRLDLMLKAASET
ncbi:MAG: glutaredoxin 3 [Filomicrobium sp.]